MMEETVKRARNDFILNAALKHGHAHNLNELEIYERLVHLLLDLKDEIFQARLDKLKVSLEPLVLSLEPDDKENNSE